MAKILVLGAGMMGSALCVPLSDRGHDVRLCGTHLDEDIVASLRATGVHPKMGLELPRSIRPFPIAELDAAAEGVDVIALGVSSAGIPWACEQLQRIATPGRPIAMITKGLVLEGDALHVLPDVVAKSLPPSVRETVFPAAIGGPCIAGEIARRVPTCVVVTGRDRPTLDRLAELFRTPYYHLGASTDVVGVEVCAALKNAFAMGVGFAAGIHEARGGKPGSVAMHNYEAAAFAQAVIEMARVVRALGGSPESALGLPGAGDLNVTCNGGRTGRFGKWLGTGLGRDEAIAKMEGATLECLEILAVMEAALPSLARAGLPASQLPMLRHLIDVALHGAKVDMPFARFGHA